MIVWYVASIAVLAFAGGWACGELRRREVDARRVDETVTRLHSAFAGYPTVPRHRLRLVSRPYDWERDA